MISHKYQTVFIHIPKCAGQSIEQFFLQKHQLTWETREALLLKQNKESHKGPPSLAHLYAEDYWKKNYLSREKFQQYFTFSFVRNPWSRLVSLYKHYNYQRIVSFEVFVQNVLPKLWETDFWFVGPQHHFVSYNQSICVDFIGRFEHLQADFDTVCSRLGIEESSLPYVNKSHAKKGWRGIKSDLHYLRKYPVLFNYLTKDRIRSNDYRDYYHTDALKEKVYAYYSADVECFQYCFES